MITYTIKLMHQGIQVAIVTALGCRLTCYDGRNATSRSFSLRQNAVYALQLQGYAFQMDIIRKPGAVGALPREATIREVLEELALTVQIRMMASRLSICAFNGGNDIVVDVGNESVGLRALMRFLQKKPYEILHVGDRFTVSGNDMATRSQCCTL